MEWITRRLMMDAATGIVIIEQQGPKQLARKREAAGRVIIDSSLVMQR
jgi:hypothetical protein